MIDGIDIFQPRDNGLPDFTKISPTQIFNGSVAASLQSMKDRDPYGLSDQYQGETESPWKNTTIDPSTGRRVEVRRARIVEELLNDGAPAARGHRPVTSRQKRPASSDYSVPSSPDEPVLPESSGAPDSSLFEDGDGNILLPPPTPEEAKSTSLNRLPVMLLEELKSLGYRV